MGQGPPEHYGYVAEELWEYPKWPRCLIVIGREEGKVEGVVTRPAQKKEGVAGKKDVVEAARKSRKPMSADKIHAVLEQGINTEKAPHKSNRVWTAGLLIAKFGEPTSRQSFGAKGVGFPSDGNLDVGTRGWLRGSYVP